MEWQIFVEDIYRSDYDFESNSVERTVKGFFEWIVDRRDLQEKLDSWLAMRKCDSQRLRKDKEKATHYREQGNNYFKNENYPGSVKSYTDSARYSSGEVDFSMAMANRSAAFFHLCRYTESLRDMEVAIKMGYPKELFWKLHLRAAKSHLKLGQSDEAMASIAKLRDVVESSDAIAGARKETILKEAKDLASAACEIQDKYEDHESPSTAKTQPAPQDMMLENSTYRFASTALVCKGSSTGDYVIAGQPIKKGDILFIEKPFAWVPVMDGYNCAVCAHCCGPLDDSVVPCRGCVNALYCSPTCFNDAWSNHQWECSGYLHGIWPRIGVSHLGFKIFLMSMVTTDKVRFNDLQHLSTNADSQTMNDVFRVAMGAMLLTTYLEMFTNFFETVDLNECLVEKFDDPSMSFDYDISTKRGKKLYVGCSILRHTLQMLANPYSVVRRSEASASFLRENVDSIITKQTRISACAYPSASKMNHSCDPTIKYYFWNNELIIKAVRDVREGEEIFACYGPHFRTMSKSDRQMYLLSRYGFNCECSACTNPVFDHFVDRFDALKCLKCFGAAIRSPTSDTQCCLDCGVTSNTIRNNALLRADEFYDIGTELSNINKWKEAIPYFERSLVIREKYLYKHNEYVATLLDVLGDSYEAIGNWLKSISYLERSLEVTEIRCGPDSLEVASGLMRMTEVCFQYLHHMPSKISHEYIDTFKKTGQYGDRVMEIFTLIVDPWNEGYQEIRDKRKRLSAKLQMLRTM